jgi:hypothetical protein
MLLRPSNYFSLFYQMLVLMFKQVRLLRCKLIYFAVIDVILFQSFLVNHYESKDELYCLSMRIRMPKNR